MSTTPIVPAVVGLQAESALRGDVSALRSQLSHLDDEAWRRPTPVGDAPVARVVAHLAEGVRRLDEAWSSRLDAEANDALLHTFDDPSTPPSVEMDVSDPAAVLRAYEDATTRLLSTLGAVRQDDWSWPVWSPLGGLETLGEAVRRLLAHHHVHADDIATGLGLTPDDDEETARLLAEFVLDALARRGGDDVDPPMVFEVITTLPGAGTWSLIFEAPAPREHVESVWEELVGTHPEALERHRLERGASPDARARIRCPGEILWRCAFARGASWDELDVHGDDQARAAWNDLLAAVTRAPGRALGRVQH